MWKKRLSFHFVSVWEREESQCCEATIGMYNSLPENKCQWYFSKSSRSCSRAKRQKRIRQVVFCNEFIQSCTYDATSDLFSPPSSLDFNYWLDKVQGQITCSRLKAMRGTVCIPTKKSQRDKTDLEALATMPNKAIHLEGFNKFWVSYDALWVHCLSFCVISAHLSLSSTLFNLL